MTLEVDGLTARPSAIIDHIDDLSPGDYSREQLRKIIEACTAQIKLIRPLSIADVFKRCGKGNCKICRDGYGHGPYLIATYTDSNGQRKTKSLGKSQEGEWFVEQSRKREPMRIAYTLDEKQVVKLEKKAATEASKNQEKYMKGVQLSKITTPYQSKLDRIKDIELTDNEFQNLYLIDRQSSRENANLNHPEIISYDAQQYRIDLDKYIQIMKVCNSPYKGIGEYRLGVSTYTGVTFLDTMISQGYYISNME